ncbi:MAG: sulfotransferase, partial [Actinomycetota bacterium]
SVPSETHLFALGIKPLRERFHHGVLGSPGTSFVYMDRREMVRSLRELCDRVFLPFLEASPGATMLAERTPEHVSCLDVIGEIYPDAAVVHIVRDGRDVARSLVSQDWPTAPRSLVEAAEEWRGSVEAGESAGRRLARYRSVRYEALFADPRSTVTDLYEWLGLPTTTEIVDGALIEAEIRFNVDPRAPTVGVGKWRDEFSQDDLEAFTRVAGKTLAALGYETGITLDRGAAPARHTPPRRPRMRRLFGGDGEPFASRKQIVEHQRLLDRVIAALTGRRLDDLRRLVGDPFRVRIVGQDEDWSVGGDAAWERLTSVIRADDAFDGRQTIGDFILGVPTATALLVFTAKDGTSHLRAFSASFRDGKLVRLTYYRFPLSAGTPG